jgi:hypothetical protein
LLAIIAFLLMFALLELHSARRTWIACGSRARTRSYVLFGMIAIIGVDYLRTHYDSRRWIGEGEVPSFGYDLSTFAQDYVNGRKMGRVFVAVDLFSRARYKMVN